MATGGEEVPVGNDSNQPFDLESWAITHKLSRKTTGTLRKEESDSLASLQLLTGADINRMHIAVGQIRLLRQGLRALGNPIQVVDPVQEIEAQPVGGAAADADPGQEGGDINVDVLQEAGDHLAALLGGAGEKSTPGGKVGADQDAMGEVMGAMAPPAMSYIPYDPLMHLTVKASKQKALQIVNFLPEAARRRVASKRKEQLTFTATPEGGLTLKQDEPGHVYMTVAEWNGANMRLCAHMLKNDMIKERELIYYMAYTAMISDLTGKYEWSSVLEYDTHYRELQAEHGFPWGTPHPHVGQHLLTPVKWTWVPKVNLGSKGARGKKERWMSPVPIATNT